MFGGESRKMSSSRRGSSSGRVTGLSNAGLRRLAKENAVQTTQQFRRRVANGRAQLCRRADDEDNVLGPPDPPAGGPASPLWDWEQERLTLSSTTTTSTTPSNLKTDSDTR